MILRIAAMVTLSLWSAIAQPSPRTVTQELYSIHLYTFFCDQPIDDDFTLLVRSCDTCPPEPRKIKWMHIVPWQRLVENRPCYEQKICLDKKGKPFRGLQCCRQKDPKFITMENDLHNLAPEDPRLERLNQGYKLVENEPSELPFVCDVRKNVKTKTLQPSPQSRGRIARTYLYMSDQYHLTLSEDEKSLFLKWHYQYPPTAWEQEKNREVYGIQGTLNRWIG